MKGELITLVVLVMFAAVFAVIQHSGGAEWSGTDDQAESVITQVTGEEYEPWFSPVWEPPSGEIESLLFSLQAALGAIIIGYFLGYYRGKSMR